MPTPPRCPSATTTTRLALFAPPPLLAGENSADYDELLAGISATVKPSDTVEEIWVRDLVDLVWETLRLRRFKACLLATNAHMGVYELLKTLIGVREAKALAARWWRRERLALQRVDRLLASAELTMDAVLAHTLALRIDDFDRIDRMIATAEARRSVVLREVERRRASLAQALRQASEEIAGSEFEILEAKRVMGRNAA